MVMVSGSMDIVTVFVVVCGGTSLSVTLKVTLLLPTVVGVPEMTPSVLYINSLGRAPPVIRHVYGNKPPDAFKG